MNILNFITHMCIEALRGAGIWFCEEIGKWVAAWLECCVGQRVDQWIDRLLQGSNGSGWGEDLRGSGVRFSKLIGKWVGDCLRLWVGQMMDQWIDR